MKKTITKLVFLGGLGVLTSCEDMGQAIAMTSAVAGVGAMSSIDSGAAAQFASATIPQILTDGNSSSNFDDSPQRDASESFTQAQADSSTQNKSYSPSDATESNLIDQYGLARFRNGNDEDHIVYHIKTADVYYASYKETGNPNAYAAHKKTADIARQFHNR